MPGDHPLPPSARVRPEVAFLDDDRAEPTPDSPARDERTRLTVLVVAAESDVRRYVRECLRARSDLRLLEAATGDAAVALAEHECPDLLIVDEPKRDVLGRLSQFSAIAIVDDVPYGAPALGADSPARPALLGGAVDGGGRSGDVKLKAPSSLARRIAAQASPRDSVDDVVQDVVLRCVTERRARR